MTPALNIDPSIFEKDYVITVTGTTGTLTPSSVSSTYNLKVKNPCVDPKFVQIVSASLPSGVSYNLFFGDPLDGYKFTHDPFTLSVSHSLCGDIGYTSTFMSQPIDLTTTPMKYDSSTREFELYSEDTSLIGMQTLTLRAFLIDYPNDVVTSDFSTDVEIRDTCRNPFGISPTTQSDPPIYSYSNVASKFTMNSFVVDPPICPVTYACVSVSGPSTSV